MRRCRSQRIDLAANQEQLAIADHHIAVGELHLAFTHGFDFPAFEHHARFKAFFDVIVEGRFFVVGNAYCGGSGLRRQIAGGFASRLA